MGERQFDRVRDRGCCESCIFVRPPLPLLIDRQKLEQATPSQPHGQHWREGAGHAPSPTQAGHALSLQQELHWTENEQIKMIGSEPGLSSIASNR